MYTEIKEIIVLVPALLGLKGNLEMTLASRFSTQVGFFILIRYLILIKKQKPFNFQLNLDLIHDKKTTTLAVLGNFALTQVVLIRKYSYCG